MCPLSLSLSLFSLFIFFRTEWMSAIDQVVQSLKAAQIKEDSRVQNADDANTLPKSPTDSLKATQKVRSCTCR